jgi:pilus assembly protein CpaB
MAVKVRPVFIIGGIAVVVGVIAAIAVYNWMTGEKERLEKRMAEAIATENVVVATVEIPMGTPVNAEKVQLVEWPKANMPPGAVQTIEAADGRVALLSIQQGDPITEVKLMPRGGAPGILSYKIPEGHRAMTLGVDQVSGVAGFITPGNRVDVVLTGQPFGHKEPMSRIILQDIPILATGQVIEQDPEGKPIVVPTVTMDLTPEDVEKLALANDQGRLQLVLRRAGEKGEATTVGATVKRIIEPGKKIVKKKRRRPPRKALPVRKAVAMKKKIKPKVVDVSVEVLRNGAKSIETFKVKEELL